MNFATKSSHTRILVWLIWFIALFVFIQPAAMGDTSSPTTAPLLGVVAHDPRNGPLFPWQPRWRWKKHALRKYRAWRRAYRRAKWAARWARLAMGGAVTLAQLADWLTMRQQHYQIGALPVLYALLETLQVRQIINRHCPTRGDVPHGTVALVLVLNRLMFPLPLYRVADWVGRTTLVHLLDVPAAKFNDDRLGRTLDALYPHLETIWQEVVERAMLKADIDLSVIFYDLTAFIAHGRYAESDVVDFGFAHNTPMNKRKFKLGLNVAADGNIPWLYRLWPGHTADQATVADNMAALAAWLQQRGYALAETLVVGDRAMLNDEIALAYDQYGLRYLAGLRGLKKEHKALLRQGTTEQFMDFPLQAGDNPQYWGRGCMVPFTHEGRTVYHKGVVVLAGPIRDQLQQSRRAQLAALEQELTALRAKVGQPYYRTVKRVRCSANARCRDSKVGDLMTITVSETATGQVNLHWQIDAAALYQAEERDGRYLLVSNDWSLSYQEMFDRYREKDGVEKRFTICKSDLKVSPVYLHQDDRIASMLLLNMIALLAYSLLERQARQQGLQLTTRQLIKRLERVTLIETHCRDGSCLRRLTPLTPEVALILRLVGEALEELVASPAGRSTPRLTARPSAPPPSPFPDQGALMSRLC
jgi:transposase